MMPRRSLVIGSALLAVFAALSLRGLLARLAVGGLQAVKIKRTVDQQVAQYGHAVRGRLARDFKRVGVSYPPARITLVGLKHERRLEVWVSGSGGEPRLLRAYPILAASGGPGPKLKEGDRQVPEGIYGIESLNPNSRFHLALRVDYPNADDLAAAAAEGRADLGGDIMIHGGNASVGCLAMGDEAAEDLFVLAAETGIRNITVILSPADLRQTPVPAVAGVTTQRVSALYERIRAAMRDLVTE